FVVTLWPMLLNSVAGVKNVSRGYIEVGQTFGLSESQLMWKIAVPAAIPYILAGLRISAGRAVIALIIGQIEVASVGIGKLLLDLGMSFQTSKFFAVFMVTATLGIVNVAIVKWVQNTWFPWVEATSAAAR
ncbi:MAG TPA: ABC transporter permease subunit, partial [Chloroflexota bacterium]